MTARTGPAEHTQHSLIAISALQPGKGRLNFLPCLKRWPGLTTTFFLYVCTNWNVEHRFSNLLKLSWGVFHTRLVLGARFIRQLFCRLIVTVCEQVSFAISSRLKYAFIESGLSYQIRHFIIFTIIDRGQ